jgi:hypothetical protein
MEFEPIILRYEGLTADQHLIDLGPVGVSLQGAAQLLGSSGTIVFSGQYAKRSEALQVRVLAGIPKEDSWDIPAILMTISPAAAPMLPTIVDQSRAAATKAVTAILKYVIGRLSAQPSDSDVKAMLGTVEKAMAEVGQTSRHAIDAVERMATYQRPAARLLVHPIGVSCASLSIGEPSQDGLLINRTMRDAIDAPESLVVGAARRYEILLSELDLKNRSCKFSLRAEADPEHRVNGEITDPILHVPNNAYCIALTEQRWLSVIAKPELKDGEIERLYISDIAAPPSVAAPTLHSPA